MTAFWSAERDEELKRRYAAGQTFEAMYRAMRAPSRSAVIGRAHRMVLKGTLKARALAAPAQQSKPPKAQTRVYTKNVAKKRAERKTASAGGVEAPPINARAGLAAIAMMEKRDAKPTGKPVRLMDLTSTTCRWPLGDPTKEDFRFCGANDADFPGRPYCAHHSRLAYGRQTANPEEKAA